MRIINKIVKQKKKKENGFRNYWNGHRIIDDRRW
jgi:hypothetical protein